MLRGTKDQLILLNELGRGAGGTVCKALHVTTMKLVAVKVVRIYDKDKRRQMVRELKSLYANLIRLSDDEHEVEHDWPRSRSKTSCTELVAFYDAYTNPEKGTVSIVLEYMDGGSLEDMISSGRKCTEDMLKRIALQTFRVRP